MDRRLERRWQTQVGGSILIDGSEVNISIAELSTNGCRLLGNLTELKPGTGLKILVAGIGPLDASVRWSNAAAVGIEFHAPLEQAVVAYFAAFCQTAA